MKKESIRSVCNKVYWVVYGGVTNHITSKLFLTVVDVFIARDVFCATFQHSVVLQQEQQHDKNRFTEKNSFFWSVYRGGNRLNSRALVRSSCAFAMPRWAIRAFRDILATDRRTWVALASAHCCGSCLRYIEVALGTPDVCKCTVSRNDEREQSGRRCRGSAWREIWPWIWHRGLGICRRAACIPCRVRLEIQIRRVRVEWDHRPGHRCFRIRHLLYVTMLFLRPSDRMDQILEISHTRQYFEPARWVCVVDSCRQHQYSNSSFLRWVDLCQEGEREKRMPSSSECDNHVLAPTALHGHSITGIVICKQIDLQHFG